VNELPFASAADPARTRDQVSAAIRALLAGLGNPAG
jgi:hypothetical protein